MAKAKIIFSAYNNMDKGLRSSKKSMSEFEKYVNGLQQKLHKAFSIASVVTATVASIKALTAAAKQCVSEYSEAEKVFKRLDAVWENVGSTTGKTYDQIMAYSDAIEKSTYFTSEAVEEASLLLAATESLTEEGFQRTLDASIDLAAALGTDLSSAASTLSKAIQEPESALSRLKTIGVSFTEDEKEQIKTLTDANKIYEAQSLILDKVEQKYQGVAKAINDTPVGTLDNIKDTLGDIKEDLGQGIVYALAPAFDWILKMLQKIERWANQLAQRAKYDESLRRGRQGDVGYLSENFTEEYLQDKIAAEQKTLANARKPLEDNYWFNVYLEKLGLSIEEFAANTIEDQIDMLMKVSGNDATFVGMVQQQLVDYQMASNNLTALTAAIQKQKDDALDSAAEFQNIINSSSTLASFISTNLAADKAAEYQSIIDTATKYLNMVTHSVPTNRSDMIALLGLDENATGADINSAIANSSVEANLRSIIADFTEKLAGLTPTETVEPSDLETILNNYGKDSRTWQLQQLEKQYDEISAVYESASDSEKVILDEILDGTLDQIMELKNVSKNTKETAESISKNFLESATKWLAGVIGPQNANGTAHWGIKGLSGVGFDVTNEQANAAASSVMGSLIDNLGEAGTLMANLAENMASMGPVLGAIVTALEYVIEGFAEVLGDTLNKFVEYGLEPLREFGRVIADVILPIMEDIMPSVQETAEFLIGIFDAIGMVLKPIISFISSTLTPIIATITAVLQLLEGPLEWLAKGLVIVAEALGWVGDWIRYIVSTVVNWVASIIPWMKGVASQSKPGDLGTRIQNAWSSVDGAFSSSTESVSTDTAISSASYRGATQVTINIYQMSPVVGDNGMREFAQMIREEFEALDYYGVSA